MDAHQYFQSVERYFWQWEEEGKVLAIPSGDTIAYKDFILDIIRQQYAQGLPPFGSLLLAVIATNEKGAGSLDAVFALLKSETEEYHYVSEAVSFLKILAELPAAFKQGRKRTAVFRAVFENCHNIISGKDSEKIFQYCLNEPQGYPSIKKPFSGAILIRDFRTIALLGSRFSSVEDIIAHTASIPQVDEPIILPFTAEENADEIKDPVDQLTDNDRTFHVGSLIRRIRSGINIPMHSRLPGEQPAGGVSDLTNKGDFDKLLISEFANDDLLFLLRLANNEALYIRRESPPVHNNSERIFLIDSSLRNWGTPRSIAFAVTIAIAKHPKTDIAYKVFLLGKSFRPLSVETVESVIEGLQWPEAVPDASAGLAEYFREFPPDKNREVFLISEAEGFKKARMLKTLADHHAGIHYQIQTDAAGHIDIYKKQQQSKRHVQHILLPLDELWKKEKKYTKKTATESSAATCYPILFPFLKRNLRKLFLSGKDIFMITKQKKLFIFRDDIKKSTVKGWELLYENLPVAGGNALGVGRSSDGTILLMVFNVEERQFRIIDLSDQTTTTGDFAHWQGPPEAGFLFFDGCFHHQNRSHWMIDSRGTVLEDTPGAASSFLSEQNKLRDTYYKFSYSFSAFKNIKEISIHESRLVFNIHALDYREAYKRICFVQVPALQKYQAEKINDHEFRFRDGSIVELNNSGILILKSSNPDIPDIFIATSTDDFMGLAAGNSFTGNKYFLKEKIHRVILMNPGHYKIKIIKIIKDFTNIGLGEAKMLVDSTDRECIYTGSAEKAYELRNRLEEEGAQATVEFSGADAKIEEELTDISAGEFYKNYVNPFINHILTYGTDIKTVS